MGTRYSVILLGLGGFAAQAARATDETKCESVADPIAIEVPAVSIESLGLRSDLIFARFDGEVAERDTYTRVATPTNPSYYFGNLLIFKAPPRVASFESWESLFANEFLDPRVRHRTFMWEPSAEDAAIDWQPFVDRGYRHDESLVLMAESLNLRSPRPSTLSLDLRIVTTESDLAEIVEMLTLGGDASLSVDSWRDFYQSQIARYRRMSAEGKGFVFGAFHRGRLVATLGIFKEGALGRYQLVGTHPDFRAQGIASQLVHWSARYAFGQMGVERLVIVADPTHQAARIYQSLGFLPIETLHSLCKTPD